MIALFCGLQSKSKAMEVDANAMDAKEIKMLKIARYEAFPVLSTTKTWKVDPGIASVTDSEILPPTIS